MLPTCLLTIVFVFSTSARDAHSVLRALEARYHHAQTLKAAFYERYTDSSTAGEGSAESGTVYFSQPGRMRWEYESPEQKLFIVDGTNVWFYVPADRTVSRAKVKESSDWRTPLALLTGKSDLSKVCREIEIVNPAKTPANAANPLDLEDRPSSPENTVLRCVPKRESADADQDIREVLLESDPDYHLVRLIIRQPGNLETEFRFANWQENLPVAETMFHFSPPPGVTVVDESALANQVH
ncbi:MAG: outer membrane lipoprotein carrier protein LolA [Candidatus Acidiferrales bacterium]